MHLVGFNIRIYHDALTRECQNKRLTEINYAVMFTTTYLEIKAPSCSYILMKTTQFFC